MTRPFALLWTLATAVAVTPLWGQDEPTRPPTRAGAAASAAELVDEAWTAAGQDRFTEAIRLASKAIERNPELATAYYVRGRASFQAGRVKAAVSDFDRYTKLEPRQAPRQWERGIALFYAERFREGARQFEDYQTFDGNDVENSVWRFLCLVPVVGLQQARATMLPIENDRRVPMMQIYKMYRGEMTPEQVLEAVEQGEPSPEMRSGRLFYARLYLGLYYEALGDKPKARKYILLAADEHRNDAKINHYMWSVADVHARKYRETPPE